MFAPISAIISLLFFASTLPNGIRLVELPADGDYFEIVAGYTTGGLTGFASSPSAKSLLLDSYAAGGSIEFVNEVDRTALRITAPRWALPTLTNRLPDLFQGAGISGRRNNSEPQDFRDQVEEEIRNALLGPTSPATDYATDDAFVLISSAPPSLREALAAIPRRASNSKPEETVTRLAAERTLRFKSDLPAGAVIFASPIPSVYYKQWYEVLLLDRLIHRIVPLQLKTTLPLTARSYYYRLELAVPAGQFPEPLEENLLQELQRLQFTPANARDLTAARQDALSYLDSKAVQEWFASHDLLSRRDEGVQWIQSISSDDMRVAARELLISNRVIASWPPKPKQTSVSSEPLSAGAADDRPGRSQSATTEPPAGNTQITPTPFPPHTHTALSTPLPERLASGVSLVASGGNAVFISGGPITRFNRELNAEDLKPFQQYRADRILVLTPAASMDHARQLWSTFKGSTAAQTGVPKGKVSSGDLGALFILKTMLDLKIIQAGWWREASARIDAGQGSSLEIQANDQARSEILSWIKSFADAPPPDADFTFIREVAIHHFESARVDLQALTWERDPQGMVQDLDTISARLVQDVARIYF